MKMKGVWLLELNKVEMGRWGFDYFFINTFIVNYYRKEKSLLS